MSLCSAQTLLDASSILLIDSILAKCKLSIGESTICIMKRELQNCASQIHSRFML